MRRRSPRSPRRRGGRSTASPPARNPGLQATVVYTPGNTIPVPDEHGHMNFDETFAAHMTAVAVEVDPDTGHVDVLDAVLVSDCGVVINPMVVEGQHQGGFAQGLGAVLLEEVRYDDDGQPLSSTLVDYTIPEASDVPRLRVVHRETPSEVAGGFRGAGEAAIIVAPAVVAGAVADALAPLGVEITSTRLHPHVLRGRVRAAGYAPDAAAFARAERGQVRAARGSRPRARAAIASTSRFVGTPSSTRISPATHTNAARVDRPVSTRPASGIVHADAIDRAHVPGREVGLQARARSRRARVAPRQSGGAARRHVQQSRADGQRVGSSGSVPRCASAAMRRSPRRFAPSFDALPVVPNPRVTPASR